MTTMRQLREEELEENCEDMLICLEIMCLESTQMEFYPLAVKMSPEPIKNEQMLLVLGLVRHARSWLEFHLYLY